MEFNGWFVYLSKFFEKIMLLAYLNLLWIGFTLAGLIIFGFFPATATMFSIARKWLHGETDIPLFRYFWKHFRMSFIQVNVIGILMFIIGFIIFIDIWFFLQSHTFVFQILAIFMIIAFFIYFILCLYLFPVYVHYHLTTLQYVHYCLIYVIGRPINSMLMVISFLFVLAVMYLLPSFIPIFGGSGLSILLMFVAKRVFSNRTGIKHQKN